MRRTTPKVLCLTCRRAVKVVAMATAVTCGECQDDVRRANERVPTDPDAKSAGQG